MQTSVLTRICPDMTDENNLIPPKMLIVLELLPACGMSFIKAGVRAGYSESYARKLLLDLPEVPGT